MELRYKAQVWEFFNTSPSPTCCAGTIKGTENGGITKSRCLRKGQKFG